MTRPITMRGVAVPYNTPTIIAGSYVEKIDPACFAESLAIDPRLPLLLWHDHQSWPVGKATAWEHTRHGLWGTFELADTPKAALTAGMAADGFQTALSIGFSPVLSEWTYTKQWNPNDGPDGMDRVTRRQARLVEVSVVPAGAYPTAQIHEINV